MKKFASNLRFLLVKKLRSRKFRDQIGPRASDFFEWHKSLSEKDHPIHLKQTWLSPAANRCMAKLLSMDCNRLFEFGSGRSTLFAMKHVHEVHKVEHSKEWHALVSQSIEDNLTRQCDGVCIEPEEGASSECKDFLSLVDEYRGLNFCRYVQYIDKFPDGYFGVSVIDGRARPACLLNAARKTKNILVLDNRGRTRYQDALGLVSRRSTLHVYGPSLYTRYFTTASFISASERGDQLIDEITRAC